MTSYTANTFPGLNRFRGSKAAKQPAHGAGMARQRRQTNLMFRSWVADASVMPRVTTGNTMAPCVVIGERAAALLQDEHGASTMAQMAN